MTVPVVSPLPPPPVRSDAPVDFSTKADAFLGALPNLQTQINGATSWIGDQVSTTASDVIASQAARTAAETARTQAQTARNEAVSANTSAQSAKTEAETARTQAQTAATSASADAIRAEDAADRAEAIVGPVGTAAFADVQTSLTDTTAGRLMQVGAGGWLGRAASDDHIAGYPTSLAENISQIYRRNADDNGVISAATSIHFAASATWGRLRVGHSAPQAWIQGGIATAGTGWTVELYHTGNWYRGTDKQHTANATGAVTLNLANASIFDLTLTGNTTLTVSNASVPAGETRSVVVRIRQGATARTLTWWAGITWLAPQTPAAPGANKVAEYVLSYSAAGWIGRVGAKN